eukprot:scaffold142044_cov32-Tisochrysis_lutea.AAC.4
MASSLPQLRRPTTLSPNTTATSTCDSAENRGPAATVDTLNTRQDYRRIANTARGPVQTEHTPAGPLLLSLSLSSLSWESASFPALSLSSSLHLPCKNRKVGFPFPWRAGSPASPHPRRPSPDASRSGGGEGQGAAPW